MSDPTPSGDAPRMLERLHENASIAIPVGLSLITGVFVALGIEGDLLARLLRTEPGIVLVALVCGVVGITAPLVLAWLSAKALVVVSALSAALLVVGVVLAASAAISATRAREQPAIDVEVIAVDEDAETATVSFTASALSLAPEERMLLRMVSFDQATTADDAKVACADTSEPALVEPESAEVLYWGESGPDATGGVSTTHVITVDTSAAGYACAVAVLSERGLNEAEDDRFSVTLVDLAHSGGHDIVRCLQG